MHVRQRKPNSRSCPDESSSDPVLIVVSAANGIEVNTRRIFHEATRLKLGQIIALTKMDALASDGHIGLIYAANPDGSNTVVLTEAGKGHQHQSAWVAVVQDLPKKR